MTFPFPIPMPYRGFPKIANAATSVEATNTTSHDVTLPSGIQVGDWLLLVISIDGGPTNSNFPSGWNQIVAGNSSIKLDVWAKRTTDLTDANFTYTSSDSETSVNRCYLITGAHPTASIEAAGAVAGSDANPNPGSVSPTWGAKKTLLMALASAPQLASGYPSGYNDNQYSANSGGTGTGDAGLSIATKNFEGTSDDPGTFTIGGATAWVTSTLAIQGR